MELGVLLSSAPSCLYKMSLSASRNSTTECSVHIACLNEGAMPFWSKSDVSRVKSLITINDVGNVTSQEQIYY